MIHTVELVNTINEKKVFQLLLEHYHASEILEVMDKLKKLGESIELKVSIPGIIICSIKPVNNDFFRIYLRVDLQALIIGSRTIDVFKCSKRSVGELRTALDEAILNISSVLSNSTKWQVSRIDFTINLTSDYVKECIELAKKGNDPYRYRDTINKPGSSYRKSKSVTLNFYDKLDQISKKIIMNPSEKFLLEEATNIFRIEVQCLSSAKLRSIRKKFNLPNKSNLFDYLRADIALWAIMSYYEKVIGKGDYYSLSQALKRIEATDWAMQRKNRIKNFLKFIAQTKSMSIAKMQFHEGKRLAGTETVVKGSRNTFRAYVKACEEIGINPVTVPKDWGIYYIPNPIRSLDLSEVHN
ncbi:hypothetical protein [Oceanobacillus sp. FSL K6-3682]|uniref:hypothetical protein n=1 Tax=Oceanobacillus sp. FSL K6-3682 TaxID=2921503 RepID=UPI0030DC47D8